MPVSPRENAAVVAWKAAFRWSERGGLQSALRAARRSRQADDGILTPPISGQIESNYDETTDSFDAMNLKSELLRGIYAYGFERPSAIQQRAIMPVIKGMSSAYAHTKSLVQRY
jgi:hypothetical protein